MSLSRKEPTDKRRRTQIYIESTGNFHASFERGEYSRPVVVVPFDKSAKPYAMITFQRLYYADLDVDYSQNPARNAIKRHLRKGRDLIAVSTDFSQEEIKRMREIIEEVKYESPEVANPIIFYLGVIFPEVKIEILNDGNPSASEKHPEMRAAAQ